MLNDVASQDPLLAFTKGLAIAGRATLCLDYDGTLAAFVSNVRDARPYPGVPEVLDSILATERARVVIVTGRYLRTTPPLLGTREQPEIWGSHGRERLLPDGSYQVAKIDEFALRALTIADAWSAEIEAAGGRCEAKPGALAFHWRGAGAQQIAAIRGLVRQRFEREALDGLLEMRYFDGGIELRVPGLDKGDVVRTLVAETPPQVPVAYLGDDLTDEDAFAALHGRGLSVLVRSEWRESAADVWIRPPGQLLEMLAEWRDALARAT